MRAGTKTIWETTVTKEVPVITGNRNDSKKRKTLKQGYQSKTNFFHFVVFQNYDGTSTARAIPREMYNKLFPGNV
jgi:hypothetical protein